MDVFEADEDDEEADEEGEVVGGLRRCPLPEVVEVVEYPPIPPSASPAPFVLRAPLTAYGP